MELTKLTLLLLVALTEFAIAEQQGGLVLDPDDGIKFPGEDQKGGDDDDNETEKRNLKFVIGSASAKAMNRRGLFPKWGGSNSNEECREGCSAEELDENGKSASEIKAFMTKYNCDHRNPKCQKPAICGVGPKPDYSYNTRLKTFCNCDGGWSAWAAWSPCTKSCGGGSKTRTRSCTNPAPSTYGTSCSGSEKETLLCNTQSCPIDGAWSPFSAWSSCTEACGGGTQTRTRRCNHPAPAFGGKDCEGSATESQACNADPCPVDGGWSDWSEFSVCSAECGGGIKTRTRTCTNPEPKDGGADCVGESKEDQNCNTDACAVDGGWSLWSAWTDCSATCGVGSQERTRSCTAPAPENGGIECEGEERERKTCNMAPCESADLGQGLGSSTVESDTCHLTYLKVVAKHARGGVAAPDEYQASVQKCEEICSQVMNCMGFDWDESNDPWDGFRCWLKNVEISAIDGVDFYQKRDWDGATVSAFLKYLNYHEEGAVAFEDHDTVEKCAEECLGNKECLSYDFDNSPSPWKNTRCWIHMNEVEEWVKGNHYLKIPCPIRQGENEP